MAFDSLIKNAQNFIGGELGTSLDSISSIFNVDKLPWSRLDHSNEAFYKPIELEADRWDKMYPYRLLVIDIKEPDKIVGGAFGLLKNKRSKADAPNGGIEYVLTQEVTNGSWEFNLPITPQMLRITDQFSINTTATMRGVVEEHNGVKFKMISAQGTTGIWAARPTTGGTPRSPSSVGSIFGGTLNAFNNTLEDLKRVKRAFTGSHPASVTNAARPEDTNPGAFSTGYYQALLLSQFLERYAQAKKDPSKKDWRLVFDIPKQNQSFIVTPVSFNLEQNQQKPMEFLWSFQLKAWKRIKLENTPPPAASDLFGSVDGLSLNANTFQRIVGTLRETRRVVGNSINIIKAVRSDFQKPLNILRQTSLLVKDFAGLTFSVIDLPRQLINDIKSSVSDSLSIIANSFQRGPDGGSNGTSATGTTSSNITAASFRADTQEARAGIAFNQISAENKRNEGLTNEQVGTGALGINARQDLSTSNTNVIYETPEEYFDLFDAVNVEDLSLTRQEQESIDNELDSVRLITVDDLRVFRSEIETLALDISNNFGAGDSTYSTVYGRTTPRDRTIPMTIEENELLSALFEAVQMIDLLTATRKWNDLNTQSSLEYVGGIANEAGIDFDQALSKLLVPVPFGLTIEEIAARYLGDPDKWVEIASINGLTSPYIDEEGFTYNLLSNGDGRQFNVDDTENKLYIGQKIILQSNSVTPFTRKITSVEKIGDGNYLISVDGLDNLNSLTTLDSAFIKGYKPGTVNSQNQIYIPVDAPSQDDDRVRIPSHLDEDKLTRISKIDWLVTDDGDLAINQLGEFQLANGLTNLVQALKIKVRTQKGTLMRHLDFGLGISHGISVADVESGEIISALNKMVEDDPRFSGVDRIDIKLNGPTLSIDMSVRISNGSGIVPISFTI